MRYTLAGGEQYSAENVFAIDFCPDDLDQYHLETPTEQIEFAMDLFLNSPGHRQNILNPHHRNVGIGISYRRPTIWFVQLFVGDYIEYETKPMIDSGMLTLSGQVKNGADISGRLSMIIYYDRLPEPLTRGQLSRTYCYTNGLPITGLRPPLEAGSSYTQDEATMEINSKRCPDPYDIDPDAPAPMSSQEARSNWQQVRDLSQAKVSRQLTFPWITADEWATHGDQFHLDRRHLAIDRHSRRRRLHHHVVGRDQPPTSAHLRILHLHPTFHAVDPGTTTRWHLRSFFCRSRFFRHVTRTISYTYTIFGG